VPVGLNIPSPSSYHTHYRLPFPDILNGPCGYCPFPTHLRVLPCGLLPATLPPGCWMVRRCVPTGLLHSHVPRSYTYDTLRLCGTGYHRFPGFRLVHCLAHIYLPHSCSVLRLYAFPHRVRYLDALPAALTVPATYLPPRCAFTLHTVHGLPPHRCLPLYGPTHALLPHSSVYHVTRAAPTFAALFHHTTGFTTFGSFTPAPRTFTHATRCRWFCHYRLYTLEFLTLFGGLRWTTVGLQLVLVMPLHVYRFTFCGPAGPWFTQLTTTFTHYRIYRFVTRYTRCLRC